MPEDQAALYESPFEWAKEHVLPKRQKSQREAYRKHWWRFVEPRPGLRNAITGLGRFIATPTTAKHRLFVWCDTIVCPSNAVIVIARDDDTTFGILHSRFHEAWALRLGTEVVDRPRYTPTTTFQTFPFPDGLTPNLPADAYMNDQRAIAIAQAARDLNEKRERWLNPPEWVTWVKPPVEGFPPYSVPRDENAAQELKGRTLTKLYNQRPQWLADAHARINKAVAAAYGWPEDITEEQTLDALMSLNQRVAYQRQ